MKPEKFYGRKKFLLMEAKVGRVPSATSDCPNLHSIFIHIKFNLFSYVSYLLNSLR